MSESTGCDGRAQATHCRALQYLLFGLPQWRGEQIRGKTSRLCRSWVCARSWNYRRGRLARLLGIYGISLVSACGPRNVDLNLLLNGPVSNFDGPAIEIYADNRERILSAISRDAGFGGRSPVNPSEWNQFVIAAFGYADAQ